MAFKAEEKLPNGETVLSVREGKSETVYVTTNGQKHRVPVGKEKEFAFPAQPPDPSGGKKKKADPEAPPAAAATAPAPSDAAPAAAANGDAGKDKGGGKK